jgi:glycosylphosphatidylinositol transamidase (GPIT) subunit GPI8
MIYTAYVQYTRNNLKSMGVAFDNLDRAMKYMTNGVKIHMSNQTYETYEEYLLIKDQ